MTIAAYLDKCKARLLAEYMAADTDTKAHILRYESACARIDTDGERKVKMTEDKYLAYLRAPMPVYKVYRT